MDQMTKDLNDLCEKQRKLIDDQDAKISALVTEKNAAEKLAFEFAHKVDVQEGYIDALHAERVGGSS